MGVFFAFLGQFGERFGEQIGEYTEWRYTLFMYFYSFGIIKQTFFISSNINLSE